MAGKTEKKYKVTKYTVFVFILIVTSVFFLIHFLNWNRDAAVNDKTVNKNLDIINSFDYSDVNTVETAIQTLEANEEKFAFDATKPMTSAQYKQIFKGNIVIGDSITEGLVVYGYLTEESVFCEIGASLATGDYLFSKAASVYPEKAIFAFGMNDILNYSGKTEPFIERYTEVIDQFQKDSPDTEIFINSISIPGEEAIADKPNLGKYEEFNEALITMCNDLGIGYIDSTDILRENPDLYEGDGIHVSSAYYPLWINNMIIKAGL